MIGKFNAKNVWEGHLSAVFKKKSLKTATVFLLFNLKNSQSFLEHPVLYTSKSTQRYKVP